MTVTGERLERVLPHRGAARYLRHATVVEPGRVEGVGAVPSDSPLARDGAVPAHLTVELAAQAAAVSEAAAAVEASDVTGSVASPQELDRPSRGYLVRIRTVAVELPTVPVETEIAIEVVRESAAGALVTYRFAARTGERAFANGRISLFRADR